MRCPKCKEPKPFIFKVGYWGIPYYVCSYCDATILSEVCKILESGDNYNLKSMEAYLTSCNKCKELRA